MIKVKNLVKEFKLNNKIIRAIDDVSFTVNKGEVFGIIGLSGAGKSTLIRCLNRLEESTEGEIYIDDINLTNLNKKELLHMRKSIGMIFQSFNLFNQKTVYQNIAYPLEIIKMNKTDIKKRVDELLEFVELSEKKDSYPKEISGGQKQRVAIARALATKPKILLSDEGTSALDPTNTKSILALLRKIVDEMGMTVVMITHQMEVAKDICDRIAVMEDGKIIEENATKELFRNPKNKRTLSFIKSLMDTTEEEIYNIEDFKGKLVRLSYDENSAKVPLISDIVKNSDISINILSGNINKLKSTSIGYLLVELIGSDEEINKAIELFKKNNIMVEAVK